MYKSQRIIVMKRGHNMFGIVNEMQKSWGVTKQSNAVTSNE